MIDRSSGRARSQVRLLARWRNKKPNDNDDRYLLCKRARVWLARGRVGSGGLVTNGELGRVH